MPIGVCAGYENPKTQRQKACQKVVATSHPKQSQLPERYNDGVILGAGLLSARLRFFVALLLAGCVGGHLSAFPLPPCDRHGDPLPNGAMARLGTVQLRAGCDTLSFSPDGKLLIGVRDRVVRVWNAADGRLMETRLAGAGEQLETARSENGRLLAITTATDIELHDLTRAKRVDARLPNFRGRVDKFTISNDGRWLLFADRDSVVVLPPGGGPAKTESFVKLMLRDTITGKDGCLSGNEPGVRHLEFSADSKRALTSGELGTRVWDVVTGQRLWDQPIANGVQCHFTADGKHVIAAPGWRQTVWHVLHADTGEEVAGLHPPTVDYAGFFAVSPDGNLLLIPTYEDYIVWDLKSGAIRHRWPGPDSWGRGVFAPDGKSVITFDTILRRWDLATGKNVYANVTELGHVAAVKRLFFAPDGARIVSIGEDQTTRVWDVANRKSVRTIFTGLRKLCWTVSPDGTALIAVDRDFVAARWPLTSDSSMTITKFLDRPMRDLDIRPREAHLLPDGTMAVLAAPKKAFELHLNGYSFSYWNLSTGRFLRWGGDPGNDYRGEYTRMSPDGRYVASPDATYDTRTGAKHILPSNPFGQGGVPLFSPDSRFVAAAARGTRIWELATGRAVAELPSDSLEQAVFSADGRRLAIAQNDRLSVWDLNARKAIFEWPDVDRSPLPPRSPIGALAFSPDGRTLATGHVDGTILLWPIPQPVADGRWSAVDANGAWELLVDENSANAYPAVWQLMDYPVEAVQFLRGKFDRVAVADAKEWDRLIAALDSPRFATREAASKRVRELGRSAEQPLRDALKRTPSPEQVARIEALLTTLASAARPRGDDLRAVRAVHVVEAIATPEARQLLADWAERGSPPRLADEAQRAADRLKYRK
jgi:WD40 repeat protein